MKTMNDKKNSGRKSMKMLNWILNIIAWIALIIGIVFLLWKIFGNSPTDLQVIIPFIIFGIAKIWEINNNQKEFEFEVKLSFSKVKEDMKRIENKIDNLSSVGNNINKIKLRANQK